MKKINNNISESYVSFEVAKLLKEKGMKGRGCAFQIQEQNRFINYIYLKHIFEFAKYLLFCPTQALAIEWLRVNFGIEIEVIKDREVKWRNYYYNYYIYKLDIFVHNSNIGGSQPNSPQEAQEQALLYVLTNLI